MIKYNTSQRTALLSLLKSQKDKPLSAMEIKKLLNNDKISLSAVYRNLADLTDEGLISRFARDGKRGFYYQYINTEECKNSIHLTCTKCGAVTHMDLNFAEKMSKTLFEDSGFSLNKAKTIVYGLCGKCE